MFKRKYPAAYNDGQYFFELPDGKPSNKLTKMICHYLEWNGHDSNRIDTKGTAVIDKKATPKFDIISGQVHHSTKVKFIPTQTKTGTEDISVKLKHPNHPYGVPWSIEVKINDKQSEKQQERENSLHSKGMLYDIFRSFDDFYSKYVALMDGL
jgi:hypothetical protein